MCRLSSIFVLCDSIGLPMSMFLLRRLHSLDCRPKCCASICKLWYQCYLASSYLHILKKRGFFHCFLFLLISGFWNRKRFSGEDWNGEKWRGRWGSQNFSMMPGKYTNKLNKFVEQKGNIMLCDMLHLDCCLFPCCYFACCL